MRPEPDDTSIRLPITFDYKGGRGAAKKGNIILAIVLVIISIVLTVFMLRGDGGIAKKALIVSAIWLLVIMFIRFRIMHERVFSDAYEALKEIDNIPSTDSFWTIYEIDSTYPYICHFKDGKSGIFVRLEKDVVVGKGEDVLFKHFDAISEAYNIAGSCSINMCQIDYMDNVGNDSRLASLYEDLNDCENPDMKDAMLSIYANLQDEMSRDYASFDVYLFTCKGKEDRLWINTKRIVDKMLNGNYLTFRALDIDGIRTTCMALFNLTDFSAIEACESIFSTSRHRGIVPIKVEHINGEVTELNKTQAQLKEEARERALQAEEAKRNKKKRGKVAKPASSEVTKSSNKNSGGSQTGVSTSQNTSDTANQGYKYDFT